MQLRRRQGEKVMLESICLTFCLSLVFKLRHFPVVFQSNKEAYITKWSYVRREPSDSVLSKKCAKQNCCSFKGQVWHHQTMWRSDGAPAAHPTLSIVQYNEQHKNVFFGEGRAALSSK
jgi:hypothetical protein